MDIAEFRLRYPEFSNESAYPNTRIQLFIDDAVIWMADEGKWLSPEWYLLAQNCLVAHFLAVATITASGDGSSVFPISLQEVDDVIVKSAVGNVSPTMDDYYTTSYGQQYTRYLKVTFSGPVGV